MKTIPISGTTQTVSFFEDDTIEVVRQWIALTVGSHPDRLFITAKGKFDREYYSNNPKKWTDLFFRLSYDGKVITPNALKTYITQIRSVQMTERLVTLEEWEAHDEYLTPIYLPELDFEEIRILGVEEAKSKVLPIPPTDLPVQAAAIPIPSVQSLYESFHPYEVTEFEATEVSETTSEIAKRIYFPLLRQDTPSTIETLRSSLQASQTNLQKLLDLHVPAHETTSIVRAKWFIPLISTRFTAPRARFEQMFYGLSVSKETPYVGFFTAKSETMRHKFYVENPKDKKPFLDTSMLRGWLNASQPQRRKPTLLLYRGKSRGSFDRIAITPDDITVSVFRGKDSKETLEDMRSSLKAWFASLDAVVPFVVSTDMEDERWEMGDMSIVANYASEVREFDMHRFPCLKSIFGYQSDSFRLLRAEYALGDISPREMQAYQILNQEEAEDTPDYLAQEMELTPAEANELFQSIKAKAEDLNVEKSLKAYPIIKFTNKEVILKFVSNLERTLKYVDVLRFVLSSDSESVNDVCPRRMEKVEASVVIPQQEVNVEGEFERDDDFFAAMGYDDTEVAEEAQSTVTNEPKSKKMAVGKATTRTYNYFNNLLQKFDPQTFDKDIYPWECKKPRQVVALTADQKAKLGSDYNYEDSADSEKLELKDPDGTIVCPAYWCIRDEAPLRADQLVWQDDGEAHCPICDGKLRTRDNLDVSEYSVIDRTKAGLYPNYLKSVSKLNGRRIPCCFQQPRSTSEVLGKVEENESYILGTYPLPALRLGWLTPDDLKVKLKIKTDYTKTTKNGRLLTGEIDMFLVGLQRPSKSLPTILDSKKAIKSPKEAPENTARCSFFRTWSKMGTGVTQSDRIIDGIDDAYLNGELTLLEEMEYVTTFLNCEVIRIDRKTSEVICGFWSDTTVAKGQTTLVMVDNDLLCSVTRLKKGKAFKMDYTPDLKKHPETLTLLRELHNRACSVNLPTFGDAIRELQLKGKSEYGVILDPFKRIQALFIPKEIVLPIVPYSQNPDSGVAVKAGYSDITEGDLPVGSVLRSFLKDTIHPGFQMIRNHENMSGMIVEVELASGFRVPIQEEEPEEPEEYSSEITETIRKHNEKDLVDGQPNKRDQQMAQSIIYESEIYEFLLFSLAKDLQTEEYSGLRVSLESRSQSLLKDITKWFKEEAYEDKTKSPVEFVNKVRTPCGQYKNKDTCNTSSLCGWHKDTCKIKVKPIVETAKLLKRLAKTLRDNEKTRALVLDDRVSPFFSTVLYLEMPHELITTSF